MNIFVLSRSPILAARMQCNRHCVRMILESAQLLSNAVPENVAPYKRTHYSHPCSVWVRESANNFCWLYLHAMELCREYTRRYGREHASQKVIERCCELGPVRSGSPRTFVQVMPEMYSQEDPVEAYRAYYIGEKAGFARWAPRATAPDWWPFDDTKWIQNTKINVFSSRRSRTDKHAQR